MMVAREHCHRHLEPVERRIALDFCDLTELLLYQRREVLLERTLHSASDKQG